MRWRPIVLLLIVSLAVGSWVSPAAAQTVRIAQGNPLTTTDPHRTVTVTDYNVLWHIYEALVWRTREAEFVPWLAESWESEDTLTWVFRLRRGVTFSNGEPFNAASVKFSIERILNPKFKSRIRTWLKLIDKVEVVDDYTVRLHTSKPFPALVRQLASIYMVPPVYTQKAGVRLTREPVGTGPYVLKEWVKDDHVTLAARERGYWGKAPKIKTLIFKPIPEASTRIAALLAGEVDLITNVPPYEMRRVDAAPNARIAARSGTRSIYVIFNAEKPPFSDKRVRQAVNYAINKDAIIASLFEGKTTKLSGQLVTPEYFGYQENIKPYPYDPEKAKALLSEAGYPQGFKTRLDTPSGRYLLDKEVAQAVAGQLAKVGIRAEVHTLEWGVYMTKLVKKHALAPMAIIGWAWPTLDAGGLLSLLRKGSKYSYYTNEEFNRLLQQANTTVDEKKRFELLGRIARILRDDPPVAFLYRQVDIYGVGERIRWEPSFDQSIWAYDIEVVK